MTPRIEVVGIDCLMLRLFDEIDEAHMPWLLAAAQRLREAFGAALVDLVPSYTTLLVHYDLAQLDDGQARQCIADALHDLKPETSGQSRELEVPVWYDPSVGPELEALGQRSGLGVAGVIERHSARTYQVFALGFAPGFAFMGLVEEGLASPRLQTPRKQVPAGSLGNRRPPDRYLSLGFSGRLEPDRAQPDPPVRPNPGGLQHLAPWRSGALSAYRSRGVRPPWR